MKIAFFVAEPSRFNGSQRSLLALVRQLHTLAVPLEVIFPADGLCVKRYQEAQIPVRILLQPNALNTGGKALFNAGLTKKIQLFWRGTYSYSKQLKNYLLKNSFTHLHCNTTKAVLMSFFWVKLAKIPIIWHVRGRIDDLPLLERKLCAAVSKHIILVANALQSGIPHAYRKKAITIYNGINTSSFETAKTANTWLEKNDLSNKFVISHFAALEPFKGQHHLITAAKILAQKGLFPTFLLIGQEFDTVYTAFLKELVAKNGLNNVHFVGWQDQVLPFYNRTDLVVLPTIEQETLVMNGQNHAISATEGLPRTIVEAMFLGKRVVSTLVAGTPEQVVNHQTGILVPPSNPQALADALETMMLMTTENRKAMEERAKAIASSKFDIAIIAKQVLNLYENKNN